MRGGGECGALYIDYYQRSCCAPCLCRDCKSSADPGLERFACWVPASEFSLAYHLHEHEGNIAHLFNTGVLWHGYQMMGTPQPDHMHKPASEPVEPTASTADTEASTPQLQHGSMADSEMRLYCAGPQRSDSATIGS